MERHDRLSTTVSRDKLGLALAGGGFRASIFHLGVLRRLAELDLLRRVEVVSTVSGGSIVGALYILLLKRDLEAAPSGNLTREEYVALIDDLDRLLLRGIDKNLRTRVVMNPLGVLRVMLTSQSLGKRMARLYERHIYADVVAAIREGRAGRARAGAPEVDVAEPGGAAGTAETATAAGAREPAGRRRRMRRGELPLRELRIRPGGTAMGEGIEDYNRRAVEEGRSVSTRLVVNATSLNSGARFWFSSVEVGDWYLGHVRHGEIDKLERRKAWLDASPEELDGRLATTPSDHEGTRRALAMARWWRAGRPDEAPPGGHWDALFAHDCFPGGLPSASPGLLRQARLPAWYMAWGPELETPVTGGLDPEGHWLVLWDAVRRIDSDVADALQPACADDPALGRQLLTFLLELYWIQSAELVSKRVGRFWDTVSVGDAVGASANFPPVFPPFQVLGLYDDLHVTRLGLTDGGVFDNVGLIALEDEGCTQIIASDTGGLFHRMDEVSDGRLPMIGRLISIFQSVLGSAQRDGLRERRRVSRLLAPRAPDDPALEEFLVARQLTDLAYFHIDSEPVDPREAADAFPSLAGYPAPPAAYGPERRRLLAGLRTDLDAFSEQEVAALVNHGYTTADRYVRRYFTPKDEPGSLWNGAWDEAPEPPRPIHVADHTLDDTLAAGSARFFRALTVRTPLAWAFTLVAVAATLWFTWPVRTSVHGAFDWLDDASVAALHAMAPWLGAGWTGVSVSLGAVLAALVAALVVVPKLLGAVTDRWLEGRRHRKRAARRLMTAGKWARALVGNVLWVFGALPIVVSVGVSAIAWISDLFFARPYLRATRNGRPGSR